MPANTFVCHVNAPVIHSRQHCAPTFFFILLSFFFALQKEVVMTERRLHFDRVMYVCVCVCRMKMKLHTENERYCKKVFSALKWFYFFFFWNLPLYFVFRYFRTIFRYGFFVFVSFSLKFIYVIFYFVISQNFCLNVFCFVKISF